MNALYHPRRAIYSRRNVSIITKSGKALPSQISFFPNFGILKPMISTAMILLPVFGLIGLGYVLHKYNIIKEHVARWLNYAIYYVSLPALIVSLFWNIEFTRSTITFFGFHVGLILVLSVLLVGIMSVFAIEQKMKVALILTIMVGNTVYMGYPLISRAYPDFPLEVAIGAGALQLISGLLIALFFIEYLVLKTKKFSVYMIDLVKNPLVIAVVIGVVMSILPHNQSITPITQFIALIGKTASPLALLTLGFFMNRSLSKKSIMLGSIAVVAKLALLPLLVFALSYLLGYSKAFVQVSVLISAMPTAVTSFVIAQKYALDEDFCADVIFASTLISIVTLPVVIWLLGV